MSHILNHDNQEYDLNSLFMFGFDPLKTLIASLAKGQKDSLKRINDIENKVSLREKKIDELDRQLKKQENFMALKFKTLSNTMANNPGSRNEASSNDIIHIQNSIPTNNDVYNLFKKRLKTKKLILIILI